LLKREIKDIVFGYDTLDPGKLVAPPALLAYRAGGLGAPFRNELKEKNSI
jgi:hypothetical protein